MSGKNLHDIVREVVGKNAPDEVPVFEELYRDSLSDPHKAAAPSAPGANAMGVEIAAFLTPVLIAVLSDATKDMLGTGLRAIAKRVWNRLTGRRSVAADTFINAFPPDQMLRVSAALARTLRHRGYGQTEVDQICRDLTAAAAAA
jgi:hypothetical protein